MPRFMWYQKCMILFKIYFSCEWEINLSRRTTLLCASLQFPMICHRSLLSDIDMCVLCNPVKKGADAALHVIPEMNDFVQKIFFLWMRDNFIQKNNLLMSFFPIANTLLQKSPWWYRCMCNPVQLWLYKKGRKKCWLTQVNLNLAARAAHRIQIYLSESTIFLTFLT